MKIIISESQSKLIRRIGMVEDMLYPTMETVFNSMMETNNGRRLAFGRIEAFMSTIGYYITSSIVEDANVYDNDRVILRIQLQDYIKTHYYTEMRDYFNDRNDN